MWKQWVRTCLRCALVCASFTIFVRTIFDKERGLGNARVLKREIAALTVSLEERKKEVADLESYLKAWQRDPFLKERVIRESLLMGKSDEKIYVLRSEKREG